MIKLEVSKTYKDRAGRLIKIILKSNESGEQLYLGAALDCTCTSFYTIDGCSKEEFPAIDEIVE